MRFTLLLISFLVPGYAPAADFLDITHASLTGYAFDFTACTTQQNQQGQHFAQIDNVQLSLTDSSGGPYILDMIAAGGRNALYPDAVSACAGEAQRLWQTNADVKRLADAMDAILNDTISYVKGTTVCAKQYLRIYGTQSGTTFPAASVEVKYIPVACY